MTTWEANGWPISSETRWRWATLGQGASVGSQPLLWAYVWAAVLPAWARREIRAARAFRHGFRWQGVWGSAQLPMAQPVWSRWLGRERGGRSPYVAKHRAERWYEW